MTRTGLGTWFVLSFVGALSLFGCGGKAGTMSTFTCDPLCPAGQTCTENGCVVEGAAASDMAVALDMPAGGCQPACAAPSPHCNERGVCVPCLMDAHCPSGSVCRPVGLSHACLPGCTDDARCGATGRCCDGHCTDVTKDPAHCGACGMACTSPHSSAGCEDSRCTAGACQAGWGNCNQDPVDGCEVKLDYDPDNCNGCGKKCSVAHARAGCGAATDDSPSGCYLRACEFGYDDCNGNQQDGCETSVLGDQRNCGACGMVCPGVPNAKVGCTNAFCALTSCNVGFADCDKNSKNGCEVVIANDKNNCGACGNPCGQGQVCVNGSCTCAQCNIPNAKTKCVNLMCGFDACVQDYSDCNNNLADGCEAYLLGDANNCKACGVVCPKGKVCAGGMCVTGNCPPNAFFTGGLPASLNGSNGAAYGSFAFDSLGNLLVVTGGQQNTLYSVSINDNKVSNLAVLPNGTWVSLAFDALGNKAYVGSDSSEVRAYNFQSMQLEAVGNMAVGSLNSLLIAPQSYGKFAGQLVGGGNNGSIAALDITKNNARAQVAAGVGNVSGMACTAAGKLFAQDYDGRRLFTVTPDGVTSVVANLSSNSDGLTWDEGRQLLFSAASGNQRIYQIDTANGYKITEVPGQYPFDGGYWPSPIIFDCVGTLLVAVNPGAPTRITSVSVK